ncbi:DUF4203 [Desulfonema limicola]|uniref:DUF4203 n=1 Tax=Desulfonema limicola TaxID=45656 RepID=A0A975B6L4_9BACT|nr:DUF4203 domain-containing protein [Desulfonema limicola]QTA79780.1 DUF4203 [Desulfonema limicola]
MNIPAFLAGVSLIFLGRKLFWLFVACMGFAVAYTHAEQFTGNQPEYIIMGIAIFFGVIGAVFAVFFQKIAVGVSGFAAGGFICLYLFQLAGFEPTQLIWLGSIAGGIAGALLMIFVFDWALILLSSISGASIIVQSINLDPALDLPVYIGLIIIGTAVQAKIMSIEPEK